MKIGGMLFDHVKRICHLLSYKGLCNIGGCKKGEYLFEGYSPFGFNDGGRRLKGSYSKKWYTN